MKILLITIFIFFSNLSTAVEFSDDNKPVQKKLQASGLASNISKIEKNQDKSSTLLPQLLQVTLGLFVVVLVIGGAAWMARRFGQFHIAAHGKLRIIGGLHMGTRERIALIQVGDKQLLLGIAPGRIETLYVLEENINIEAEHVAAEGTFAQRLAQVMRGRK